MPGKTESIIIHKGLSLYKQPLGQGKGSPNWYVRVYLPFGGKVMHIQSTRTSDQKVAREFARGFYGQCLARKHMIENGISLPDSSGSDARCRFDRIADAFLDRLFSDAGEDRKAIRNANDHKGAIFAKNGLGTYFGKTDIRSIGTEEIRAFLRFQIEKSSRGKLQPATQKRAMATLSQVFRFAHEKRIIVTLPFLPRIKLKDNPRPWFEKDEYKRLYRTAFGLAQACRARRENAEAAEWQELGDFIVFQVGTFLRPGEWAELHNRDIRLIDNDQQRFLHITVRGKTGVRQSVSMQTAIEPLKRLTERNGNDPAAYVFMPEYQNRDTAKKRMAGMFRTLLERSGLRHNAAGEGRTIYSLRHTALMLRMTEGDKVDIFMLAKNAGTSIEMLQRFYLKHLGPLQAVENLQSFR